MRRPVEPPIDISTRFGDQVSGFFGKHLGIDYAGPEDRDVHAPIAGVIVQSSYSRDIGNFYEIKENGNGRLHRLMHLKTRPLKVGAWLDEGEVIAKSGGKKGAAYSGTSSTGPHVHWDIRKANTLWNQLFDNYFDPERLLAPAPPAPPPAVLASAPSSGGETYTVHREVAGYITAADAAGRQHSNSRVPVGTYAVFNRYHDMLNITRQAGTAGWWINPADNTLAPDTPARNTDRGNSFVLSHAVKGYLTAADAMADRNRRNTVASGNYAVFNRAYGAINVTTRPGAAGSWINPNA